MAVFGASSPQRRSTSRSVATTRPGDSQEREQRTLPLTTERDRSGLVRDLERPEYPEIERDGRH